MKFHHPHGFHRPQRFIEPLEARIAPAVIRIGAQGMREDPRDAEYIEQGALGTLFFVDTSTSFDPISQAVDSGASSNTFYLRLSAGDKVYHFTEANGYADVPPNDSPLIFVKAGKVIAFFTDANNNNEYDDGELTGLSLGANASVDVKGEVHGDIVTNLDERGTAVSADDTVRMTGPDVLIGPKQAIAQLSVSGGSVFGKVLSGGDIRSLSISSGDVEGVFAGAAAAGKTFSFFTSPSVQGTASFTLGAGQAGASISNAVIKSATDRIEAGAGGAGAIGGSLTNIQITADNDGIALLAGAGGAADLALKRVSGGAGGSVNHVLVAGVSDFTPNSEGGNLVPDANGILIRPGVVVQAGVVIQAGSGGEGLNTGVGGAGGAVRDIQVGYEMSGGSIRFSGDLLSDSVAVVAGHGGEGKTGGAGGVATAVKIRVLTPDLTGNEVDVEAGDGGNSNSPTGRAGAGGSVSIVETRNQVTTFDADTFLRAGNGGTTQGNGAGAAGGSISTVTLLGFNHTLVAGDGSDGKTGGLGGSITGVTITQDDVILNQNLLLNAGRGGNASGGNGGNAGNISRVNVQSADYEAFQINVGIGGQGGSSIGGRGGNGGSVSTLDISDTDTEAVRAGVFEVHAGSGGAGEKGGGTGGALTNLLFLGIDLDVVVTAGNGGNATLRGIGGNGGALTSAQFVSIGNGLSGAPVFGTMSAGSGGAGAGAGGSGGAGGNVTTSNLQVVGDAHLLGGTGGDGALDVGVVRGGAAGRGGSILTSAISADAGSGEIRAGNAGNPFDPLNPTRIARGAGAGGSIIGGVDTPIGILALNAITVRAGDGSSGGAGGDIRNVAYGSSALGLLTAPAGNILVQAGNGSQGFAAAGKGGLIDNVQGAVSATAGTTTKFSAGAGGGDVRTPKVGGGFTYTGSGRTAVGGSLSNLSLVGGGATGVVLTVDAGAGGHTGTLTGSRGGDVRSVFVNSISADTNFRSVAAGDGGDGLRLGGAGGSVTDIHVQDHDIGVRTGQVFGFTTMGGIFAGAGGLGVKRGLAGSVINVSADSIASIVAGKTSTPELVERADLILINGSGSDLLLDRNGAFATNSPFTLSFEGDSITLPGNATNTQVESALNSLSKIAAAGGVKVSYTADGGYFIQFGATQLATISAILSSASLANALNSLPAIASQGVATVTDDPNGFQVRFGGSDPVVVPFDATSVQLANALNSDQSLAALGTFTVNVTPTGAFELRFATNGFGNKNQITGVENVAVNVTEQIRGAILNLSSTELQRGQFDLVTQETRSGSQSLSIVQTVPGDTPLRTSELVAGDGISVSEVQQLDLSPLTLFPNSQFTLNFTDPVNGTDTTSRIRRVSDPDQQAVLIRDALNSLPGIIDAGLVTVSRSTDFSSTFLINFTDVEDHQAITGEFLVPETQRLNLGNLPLVAGAKFNLSFKGSANTPDLAATATAANVRDALNNLITIKAVGGVTVVSPAPGVFDITFAPNTTPSGLGLGDQPLLDGASLSNELQTIRLTNLAPGAIFQLTFDSAKTFTGPTTPNAETTGNITVGATPAATATAIATALNNLASVKATSPGVTNTGSVSVAANLDGSFRVTFNQQGNQEQITGIGLRPETQALDLSQVTSVPTGEFTLTFQKLQSLQVTETILAASGVPEGQRLNVSTLPGGATFTLGFKGDTTGPLSGISSAQDISAALNVLPSIIAERGVSVFIAPGGFDINFNTAVDEPQLVALTTSTVATTVRLPFNATAADIKATLQAIPSNGVADVTAGATPGTFNILFSAVGDQAPLLATGFLHEQQQVDVLDLGNFVLRAGNSATGTLTPASTAADVQAALNGTGAIAGGVTVTAGSNSSFIVRFNADGDVTNLGGSQTEIMPVITSQEGTATRAEQQQVRYFPKGAFDPLAFSTANLVGAIADINERNSTDFHFVELNGIPGFNVGDAPIDGIVMAKIFNRTNSNFIPEAALTLSGFFDNDNRL